MAWQNRLPHFDLSMEYRRLVNRGTREVEFPQAPKPDVCEDGEARLNRLLKKSEKWIPRRLKSPRDDKNKKGLDAAPLYPN